MKNLSYSILSIIVFIFLSCSGTKGTQEETVKDTSPESNHPKNIILLIGDGMGIAQITASMYNQENDYTSFERFTNIGFHKTHSASDLITDSAAGATAFSCGEKSFNEAIAVNTDSVPMKTILEDAEDRGMSTGLIATSTIVHATPASFIAHVPDRHSYEEIATDFLDTEVDIFVGGGMKYFQNRESDSRNIRAELEQKNYVISDYKSSSIDKLRLEVGKNYGFFTAADDPKTYKEGRRYLQVATRKAISFLGNSSEKGYFLMVEGSQIDWGGHANDSEYIISEMKEFEMVIEEVLDWAEQDGETLVIVTSDHDCGGYAINPDSERGNINGAFTTTYHTASMIPIFAYGPGAEKFRGIYENTLIYDKMMEALKMK